MTHPSNYEHQARRHWPAIDHARQNVWLGAALEAFFGVVREAHALALIESWRAARDAETERARMLSAHLDSCRGAPSVAGPTGRSSP